MTSNKFLSVVFRRGLRGETSGDVMEELHAVIAARRAYATDGERRRTESKHQRSRPHRVLGQQDHLLWCAQTLS